MMARFRIISRRRRVVAAIAATMVLGSAVAGSVVAKGVDSVFFPDPFAGGWYPVPVTGQFVFDVEPASPPAPGAYLERIVAIQCAGVNFSHPPLPRTADTPVTVQTLGSSVSVMGTNVSCTAFYERAAAECFPFIGCVGFGSFEPAGTAVASTVVKIDTSAPLVQAHPSAPPNANGWYRLPGTVTWTGVDILSGIYDCETAVPFGGTDTASAAVAGGCRNNAGIPGQSTYFYRFDGTPPQLAPTVVPGTVALHGSATASPNATDNLSGIDTESCGALDTSMVGTHTVECQATDRAGNPATASVSYSVAYGFSGFEQPVDASARNVAKAGRTIPLKWRVTDGVGNPVTNLTSVTVSATTLPCSIGATTDQIEEYASGGSGLQDLGGGLYQFNWSVPKSYAGSCKTMSLNLGDGVQRTADFEFTK